ncbi:guanitoxin biosynthesis heme-dependent pre-guanitoxin N-hydroxylase GntA [Crossiella equi]|nr:guanitoxin biosynthesis heme-dependent pre-guanitoxin N-hydroxylase GntA [Crossiella equi]
MSRTAEAAQVDLQEVVDHVSAEDFTCLGARAALRKKTISVHHYGEFGASAEIGQMHEDLVTFTRTTQFSAKSFASFVAVFDEMDCPAEAHFERRLWELLQALHGHDAALGHGWHPDYETDPASPRFAYCVGGHPFFVVGMHPGASRPTRRFRRPAMVFNSHIQFWALQEHFFTMRERIREREIAAHGSVNPSFLAYEDEARHYGGRFTEGDWACPFRAAAGVKVGVALPG